MRILLAPAEFAFRASNYHITYNLVKKLNIKFHILTGRVIEKRAKRELKNAEIHELNRPLVLYPVEILIHGRKLIDQVDLIHHISPFAIGKDFNLLALQTDKQFVIGPMEIPHRFLNDELEMLKIPRFLQKLKGSKLRTSMSVKTMERCDVAIAVNRQTRKYLLNFVDKQNVKVIPLGVDTKTFRFSLVPNNHEILAVGMHIKRKGFDYLIRAMPEIVKEYPDAKLHITSRGPQTHYLKNLVKKLGLNRHVIFHGRVSDEALLKLYRRCRVFCHPSISESFSPVRLEAMATGRPVVVTTAASGANEMIENGKTGFIVPPADSDALADTILKVFSNYKLNRKIGKRAREVVEKRYDWNIVAKKYHNIYQELSQ